MVTVSDFAEWVALCIQSCGVGWEFAAIVGGLSTGMWAVGFVIWLIGIALWVGAKR